MDDSYYLGNGNVGMFDFDLEWLPVSHMNGGYMLQIPVITIQGKQPGPTMGLTAAVHGDEHTGTEIIRRIVTTVDRSTLRGRIKAVPVANPLAFEARTRSTPLDMNNLNRAFPGIRGGWLTDQIASVLAERYLPGVDYLLDYHAGGYNGWCDFAHWVGDRPSSLATGSDYIYQGPTPKGMLTEEAQRRGAKAAVALEFGGIDCSDHAVVRKGVRCAINLMKYWGMLPGQPEMPRRQYIFKAHRFVQPTQGGILYKEATGTALGDEASGGSLLGRVVDPYTFRILEELRPPFDHSMILHARNHDGSINPGEVAFICGDLGTAEIVEN